MKRGILFYGLHTGCMLVRNPELTVSKIHPEGNLEIEFPVQV